MIDFSNLEKNSLSELQQFAKETLGLSSVTSLRKPELVKMIAELLQNEAKRDTEKQLQEEAEHNKKPEAYDNFDIEIPDEALLKPEQPKRREQGQNQSRNNNRREQPVGGAEDINRGNPLNTQYDPTKPVTQADGILEIMADGFGFLRAENCYISEKDVYVNSYIIRKCGLRTGDRIKGLAQILRSTEKFPSLFKINELNGKKFTDIFRRPYFDNLTPIYPEERLTLETEGEHNELSTRIIDLISPIGKGQRGLIVSPPKAGKTTLLKQIANGITRNHPDVKLIILLIDERPEEVTDIKRSTSAEVIFSTFDEHPEHHAKVAEMILEYGKRLVESGDDVVILLDSITRLSRSYNLIVPTSGRSLSGGLDPTALFKPKKFFGAARNIENGGSLTIIATALVETGSKMDDVIFEEFKGTGNMEIHLNRKLSERRIFPAFDLNKSGTRRDDLLLSRAESTAMQTMRRNLSEGKTDKVTEVIITGLSKTKNNAQFVSKFNSSNDEYESLSREDEAMILERSFSQQ